MIGSAFEDGRYYFPLALHRNMSISVQAMDAKLNGNGDSSACSEILMDPSGADAAGAISSSSSGRLWDVLNQNEARAKYRALTSSPSDGEDVRWYFSKVPLSLDEAAASVPPTEVVGKSDFLRFSISDSLALEAAFLEQEEELVSAWWKEYAECSEGPLEATGKGGSTTSKTEAQSLLKAAEDEVNTVKGRPSSSASGALDSNTEQCDGSQLYESDEVIGVPVKGGLYEVDLFRRRCYPVYWRGDHRRVLRGHWFAQKAGLDWLPLREDMSEQLEFAYRSQIWHRRTFQPSGQFAARVNLQGATQGLHALFVGEDDTWEAWLGVDATGISFVLGLRGSGIKLRRGFAPSESPQPTQDELRQRKEEEMDDYCSKVPVRHLVFMVHGIGQRLENANLVDDVGTFRRTTATLAEHHLTTYQRNTQRVLYIPCQWRRGLKLGGEEAVESCTLEGVRALRTMLSATVHDVLYYMSPVYCQDIIDSVTGQLNRLYCKFIKRNPSYDGKVSIYGHSLGSVLSYDILCHQNTLTSALPIEQINSTIHNTAAYNDQAIKAERDAASLFSHSDRAREGGDSFNHQDAALKSDGKESNGCCLEEITNLRAEVATLKAKLMAMEEGHAAKQEVASSEMYDEQSNEGNVAGQSSQNSHVEGCKLSAPLSKKSILSEREERRLTAVEPEEKSLPGVEVGEGIVIDTKPEVASSAGPSTLYSTPQGDRTKTSLKARSSSRKRHTPYIEYTKLAFEVDTFFAVGSPVGVFLALRNVRLGTGLGKDYWQDEGIDEEMPACRQLLNIFHPFDPVAYRIEPLVCKEYMEKRPVFVPYHKGGKRLHIGMQELGEDISARSKALVNSLSTVGSRVVHVFSTSSNEKETEHDIEEPEERTYGSLMMERLTGSPEGRIDHMLQDATFEHQYLQAISSHTAYWQDPDTALFILKHLYCNIPEEGPKPKFETNLENIEEATIDLEPCPLLYQNESGDEEVAFTFSSKEKVLAVMSGADNVGGISSAMF